MTTSTMAPCPVCQCPLDLRLAKESTEGNGRREENHSYVWYALSMVGTFVGDS